MERGQTFSTCENSCSLSALSSYDFEEGIETSGGWVVAKAPPRRRTKSRFVSIWIIVVKAIRSSLPLFTHRIAYGRCV